MNCSNPVAIAESPLADLNREIAACTRCTRLVAHCRQVAEVKRKAYADWTYWGKPVPSFGDPAARLLIIGLAPGAHGANRTGRMFTGDKSGDFLYRALHRAGFASQPESTSSHDGLQLRDAWITAAAHCAPPDNKPTPEELRNCRPFLDRELALLANIQVVVTLGRIATDAWLAIQRDRDAISTPAAYPFGHNVLHDSLSPALLCSYHPSQQNTSTGRLTQSMLDDVFLRAARILQAPQ